jgi:hypothetical protein
MPTEYNVKINNKQSKKERSLAINRFNKSLEESKFLEEFQNIMIERLNLSHERKFNKINVNRIITQYSNKRSRQMNTEIKNGFLLSCVIEPEIYIKIQDIIKKLTGSYQPMDQLIHLLLLWFCKEYTKDGKRRVFPFERRFKGIRYAKLALFHKKFSNYYCNTITSCKS